MVTKTKAALELFPPPMQATPSEAISWAEKKAPDLKTVLVLGEDHHGELVVLYGDLMDRYVTRERATYLLERAKYAVMFQDASD